MAFTRIGFNITQLTNITAPNITIETNHKILVESMPTIVNELTEHFLGLAIMITMFIIIYWILSDKTRDGDFNYSDIRASSITFAIVTNIGAIMLALGLISNVQHVGLFLVLFAITETMLLFIERKNDN